MRFYRRFCLAAGLISTVVSAGPAQSQRAVANCTRQQGQLVCDIRTDQAKQINDVSVTVNGKSVERTYEPFDRSPKTTAYYMLIQQSLNPRDAARAIERVAGKVDVRRNYGIATFSDRLTERAALGATEGRIASVKDDKDLYKADAKSELFQASIEAINKLSRFSADRKALVLFADGRVTTWDRRDRDSLVAAAKENNVLIYSIFFGRGSRENERNLQDLRSDVSGLYFDSVDCKEKGRCETVDLPSDLTKDFHLYLERGGILKFANAPASDVAITVNFTDGTSARTDKIDIPGPPPPPQQQVLDWIVSNPVSVAAGGLVALGVLMFAGLAVRSKRASSNSHSTPHGDDDEVVSFDPTKRKTELVQPGDTLILTPTNDIAPPSQVFAWLQFLDAQSSRVPIGSSNVRIGRGRDNDIILNNKTVHRQHAIIKRSPDGRFSVHHLGGENIVVVNGQQAYQQDLGDNDMIELGEVRMRFFTG